MLRRAALRRHDRVHPVVLDAHECVLAQLAASGAHRGEHDDGLAPQLVRLGAAGGLEGLRLRACPLRGARCVLPCQRHPAAPCVSSCRPDTRIPYAENAGVPTVMSRTSGPLAPDTPEFSCIFDMTSTEAEAEAVAGRDVPVTTTRGARARFPRDRRRCAEPRRR